MPSSAGSYSSQLRLRLALTAIAIASVALSLVLAFASVYVPNSIAQAQQQLQQARATQQATIAPSDVTARGAPRTSEAQRRSVLWPLITPWALAIDAIAVVGFLVAARLWRR